MTTTLWSSKRARPATVAGSSPKSRSPWSSRKSSNSSLQKSRVCGRREWRASWVVCQAVRLEKTFWRRRWSRSSSLPISSRWAGSSSACSSAMRVSSSRSGSSKSSVSGMVHRHGAGAKMHLELGYQLGSGVDGKATCPHDHLLRGQEQVDEDGHGAGMTPTECSERGNHLLRVGGGTNAYPQGVRFTGGLHRSPPIGGERGLERADVLGQHHAALVGVVDPTADEHRLASTEMLGGCLERLGEDGDLDGAGHVFERDEGHPVAALRRRLLEGRHLTEEQHARPRALGRDLARRCHAEGFHHRRVAGQWMPRNVEAEDLLLELEALIGVPLGHNGDRLGLRRDRRRRQQIEKRCLALGLLTLLALAGLERGVDGGPEVGARQAEGVERARLDQRLQHPAVD